MFKAEAGVRYQIVLGNHETGRGGEFTLTWNEAADPGWLRYVSRLEDGYLDSRGSEVDIRRPGDLVMNNDGTIVYLASSLGLSVFSRDTDSGELALKQVLDADIDLTRASLVWDSERNRLLADECGRWFEFSAAPNNATQLQAREIEVSNDPSRCASFLLLDSAESNLYRIAEQHVQQFAITDDGDISFLSELSVSHRIRSAILAPNDLNMYVVTDRLLVLAKNTESALLELTEFESSLNFDNSLESRVLPIAISEDGDHLFVFDQNGQTGHVYLLRDSREPANIWSLEPFWSVPDEAHSNRCRFADTYGKPTHLEVFCPSLVFAARWNPLDSELTGIDYITDEQGDRFNSVPLPSFGIPRGFVVSPDEKHVYLSTPYAGLLVFERSSLNDQDADSISHVISMHASPRR